MLWKSVVFVVGSLSSSAIFGYSLFLGEFCLKFSSVRDFRVFEISSLHELGAIESSGVLSF